MEGLPAMKTAQQIDIGGREQPALGHRYAAHRGNPEMKRVGIVQLHFEQLSNPTIEQPIEDRMQMAAPPEVRFGEIIEAPSEQIPQSLREGAGVWRGDTQRAIGFQHPSGFTDQLPRVVEMLDHLGCNKAVELVVPDRDAVVQIARDAFNFRHFVSLRCDIGGQQLVRSNAALQKRILQRALTRTHDQRPVCNGYTLKHQRDHFGMNAIVRHGVKHCSYSLWLSADSAREIGSMQ